MGNYLVTVLKRLMVLVERKVEIRLGIGIGGGKFDSDLCHWKEQRNQ